MEIIDWRDYNRETAVIITNDGKVYEDLNHQYCLDEMTKDYFKGMTFEKDIDDMALITDGLFRNGTFHGFDLFIGKDDSKILASHYERAFDVPAVDKAAREYAKKHNCILTTFFNPDKLGKEMKLVA